MPTNNKPNGRSGGAATGSAQPTGLPRVPFGPQLPAGALPHPPTRVYPGDLRHQVRAMVKAEFGGILIPHNGASLSKLLKEAVPGGSFILPGSDSSGDNYLTMACGKMQVVRVGEHGVRIFNPRTETAGRGGRSYTLQQFKDDPESCIQGR